MGFRQNTNLPWYKKQNQQNPNGSPPAVQSQPLYNRASAPGSTHRVGNLTTDQLLDPSLGFGITFQASANKGAVEALKDSMSTENPADAAARDSLRNYYMGALGDLGNKQDMRMNALDSQSQRGLTNLLGNLKKENAGTGLINSRQYAGAQGDIIQRLASEYTKGVQDINNQGLQDANAISGGLGTIYNQDLQNRNTQFGQGQSLANLLLTMSGNAGARDQFLAQQQMQQDKNNQDFWGDIIKSLATGAGSFAGRK